MLQCVMVYLCNDVTTLDLWSYLISPQAYAGELVVGEVHHIGEDGAGAVQWALGLVVVASDKNPPLCVRWYILLMISMTGNHYEWTPL